MDKQKNLSEQEAITYLANATEGFLLTDNPIDVTSFIEWNIGKDLLPQIHRRNPSNTKIAEQIYLGKIHSVFSNADWDVSFLTPKILIDNKDKNVKWLIEEIVNKAKYKK